GLLQGAGAEQIDQRDHGDAGDGDADMRPPRVPAVEAETEGGEVQKVAGDTAPEPGPRVLAAQDADSGGDLAQAIGAADPGAVGRAETAGQGSRCQQLDGAEPDGEPCQAGGNRVGGAVGAAAWRGIRVAQAHLASPHGFSTTFTQ